MAILNIVGAGVQVALAGIGVDALKKDSEKKSFSECSISEKSVRVGLGLIIVGLTVDAVKTIVNTVIE